MTPPASTAGCAPVYVVAMNRLLVPLMILAWLPACMSPSSIDDLPPELRTSAVISMQGPGRLPPGGTYTWHPASAVLVDDPRVDGVQVEHLVRDALVAALADRGWFPAPGASVTLGYLVALDDPLREDTVKQVLGIDPGLVPAGGRHERGTLLVEFHRSGTNLTLWRGAVQILADLELSEDLRRQRVQRAVRALVDRLP